MKSESLAAATLHTCVRPEGRFAYGVHRPRFPVANLRETSSVRSLGETVDGHPVDNRTNFPEGSLNVTESDWVYEIPNPFPFRGTTYISKIHADRFARRPAAIALASPQSVSLSKALEAWGRETGASGGDAIRLFRHLPEPLLLALATTSTDPRDLERLAEHSARFLHDPDSGRPVGMHYEPDPEWGMRARIHHPDLFEAVANNRCLPDDYKEAMVLRPGAQGDSEIVGEWTDVSGRSHIWEYLRRNSYIPWGHFAANMAEDAVRYRIEDLRLEDMLGLRHLYYQRTLVRLAEDLGLPLPRSGRTIGEGPLEELRKRVLEGLSSRVVRPRRAYSASLWGWNFGFDFAPTGYRLNGSHQQVHQQFALVPDTVPSGGPGETEPLAAFSCGDLVTAFADAFRKETGRSFFGAYIRAIRTNRRMVDSAPGDSRLIVYEDEHVLLYAPKAQTSQWELQIMTASPVGNVVEADTPTRRSLDRVMLIAVGLLSAMGAKMVTAIEFSKRFNRLDAGQHLLYSILPRLPHSPGAFSESQLRWISRHYPEDFAAACRLRLPCLLERLNAEAPGGG